MTCSYQDLTLIIAFLVIGIDSFTDSSLDTRVAIQSAEESRWAKLHVQIKTKIYNKKSK